MKKYWLNITVVIILAVLALLLYQSRTRSTLGWKAGAFEIAGTERINTITITSGDSKVILSKEENDQWSVNSAFEPADKAVEALLETLTRLRISNPAPLSVDREINEGVRKESARIDIRTGRRLRTYLVYSSGPDSPTYMSTSGDSRVYETEVVGFSGNVASLFVADEGYWRSNILFMFKPADIAEIIVLYPGSNDDSFMLRQSAGREVSLFSYPEALPSEYVNDSLAIRYLSGFLYVPFERFANADEKLLLDSLRSAGPDYFIRVTGQDEAVSEVRLHKILTGTNGTAGNTDYDIFRLHAIVNGGQDMIIVPWHYVDLLLRSYSYFYQGAG